MNFKQWINEARQPDNQSEALLVKWVQESLPVTIRSLVPPQYQNTPVKLTHVDLDDDNDVLFGFQWIVQFPIEDAMDVNGERILSWRPQSQDDWEELEFSGYGKDFQKHNIEMLKSNIDDNYVYSPFIDSLANANHTRIQQGIRQSLQKLGFQVEMVNCELSDNRVKMMGNTITEKANMSGSIKAIINQGL